MAPHRRYRTYTPCNLPQLSCLLYVCLEITKKVVQDGCLAVASCSNLSIQVAYRLYEGTNEYTYNVYNLCDASHA